MASLLRMLKDPKYAHILNGINTDMQQLKDNSAAFPILDDTPETIAGDTVDIKGGALKSIFNIAKTTPQVLEHLLTAANVATLCSVTGKDNLTEAIEEYKKIRQQLNKLHNDEDETDFSDNLL